MGKFWKISGIGQVGAPAPGLTPVPGSGKQIRAIAVASKPAALARGNLMLCFPTKRWNTDMKVPYRWVLLSAE